MFGEKMRLNSNQTVGWLPKRRRLQHWGSMATCELIDLQTTTYSFISI